jgi:hypothetical protein
MIFIANPRATVLVPAEQRETGITGLVHGGLGPVVLFFRTGPSSVVMDKICAASPFLTDLSN